MKTTALRYEYVALSRARVPGRVRRLPARSLTVPPLIAVGVQDALDVIVSREIRQTVRTNSCNIDPTTGIGVLGWTVLQEASIRRGGTTLAPKELTERCQLATKTFVNVPHYRFL